MITLASCAALATPARAETDVADVDFALEELTPPALLPSTASISRVDLAPALYTASDLGIGTATGEPQQQGYAIPADQRELSFGQHVRAIRTELLLAVGHQTVLNLAKIAKRGNIDSFSFTDEGWFGKDTDDIGVDKSVHAHNTYVLAELLGARIRRNTGTTRGTAKSGAILASGLMLYSEVYDGFKGGFGFNDLIANSMGAGFSVLRHTTPGLSEKLDFRFLLIPNRNFYSPTGKEHYRQVRHLLALKLSGFERLRQSPLRFVELHAGYYATGFTDREQDRGEEIKRRPFVGVGVNLNELFFRGNPRSRVARAASQALNYWQPPYTYVHTNQGS